MSKRLHEILLEIQACPTMGDSGICGNILAHCSDEEEGPIFYELQTLIGRWPKKNKDPTYPVDGWAGFSADMNNGTFWSNPRRLELLEWCINETNS